MSISDNLSAQLAKRIIDQRGGFVARTILRHLCRYVADTAIEMWGLNTSITDVAELFEEVIAAIGKRGEAQPEQMPVPSRACEPADACWCCGHPAIGLLRTASSWLPWCGAERCRGV